MTQQLLIDGQEIEDLTRFSLRWHYGEDMTTVPTLYCDGKRVVKPWSLKLDLSTEADPTGGNANTM